MLGVPNGGLWHLGKATVADNALAEKFFQQAIEIDPSFAGGYRGLALSQMRGAAGYRARSIADARGSAESLARQAVTLDGADAEAHATLGVALHFSGDNDAAQAEAERALTITPNLASAHGVLGAALIFSGRPKEDSRPPSQYKSSIPATI